MKTLQNNFTTPEQSKRLLELGVPANSADCYYDHYKNLEVRVYSKLESSFFDTYSRFTPCWSVGRLMEIIDICVPRIQSDTAAEEYPSTVTIMNKLGMSYVDYLVGTIGIATKARMLDFSKLEEQE